MSELEEDDDDDYDSDEPLTKRVNKEKARKVAPKKAKPNTKASTPKSATPPGAVISPMKPNSEKIIRIVGRAHSVRVHNCCNAAKLFSLLVATQGSGYTVVSSM